MYLKASLRCFSPRGKCSNSIPTRGAANKHTPTFKQCLKLYEGVLSQPSPCSSRLLQSSRALSYRNRCLCIGLKRASSFMRVGPLLWLIHTLKDPCIRTRPSSQMSPCNQARENHSYGSFIIWLDETAALHNLDTVRLKGPHILWWRSDAWSHWRIWAGPALLLAPPAVQTSPHNLCYISVAPEKTQEKITVRTILCQIRCTHDDEDNTKASGVHLLLFGSQAGKPNAKCQRQFQNFAYIGV